MPTDVVDHISNLEARPSIGHRFQQCGWHQIGCRGGATATWEDGPKSPEGACGASVGFEKAPTFARSEPTGQQPPREMRFAALLPQVVVSMRSRPGKLVGEGNETMSACERASHEVIILQVTTTNLSDLTCNQSHGVLIIALKKRTSVPVSTQDFRIFPKTSRAP